MSDAARLGAREAYALWAESYPPSPHNPLMEAEQAVIAPLLAAARPDRALDAGTGTGRYRPLLAAAGARLIVGIDLSLPMLQRGRDQPGRSVCGDACRLPIRDACVDLICSSLMAGDLADLAAWIGETARVLVPGGTLIYSDFHPSWSALAWRRTFRAPGGREIELPYQPHALAEHSRSLERSGFELLALHEPLAPGWPSPVAVVVHALRRPG